MGLIQNTVGYFLINYCSQIHLLQSQGHSQGHSSVQRQEQQHDFISRY